MLVEIKKYLNLLNHAGNKSNNYKKELVKDIVKRKLLRQIIDVTLLSLFAKNCCSLPNEYSQFLPDLGDSDRNYMSQTEINFLGQQIIYDIQNHGDMLDDFDLNTYLNSIGNNLVSFSASFMQQFNFYALKGNIINAFALPGGYICIYNGLIYNTQTEAELVAVISHEIGHIVQHHIFRNIAIYNRNQWLSIAGILASALIAPFDPSIAIIAAQSGQGLAVQNILAFSREFEREADRVGQGIMSKAGYDPHAMPTFFQRLAQINQFNNNDALAFLQTHPVTRERISEAQERANTMPVKMRADSIFFQMMREKCRCRELQAQAIIYYQHAIANKKYADLQIMLYGLSYAYYLKNNFHNTINTLKKINNNKINNHPAYFSLLASSYTKLGNFNLARNIYKKSLVDFPNYKSLWLGQINNEISANNLKIANEYLLGLSQTYPQDLDIWSRIAFINADSNLNNLKLYYYALGNELVIKKDFKGALEKYQLALRVVINKDNMLDDVISAKIISTQEIINNTKKYKN